MKGFFLSILFCAAHVFGLETVGQVVAVDGIMRAQNGSQDERILMPDSEVYLGDALLTEGSGRGQIRFTDGTLLLLIPGSRYVIEAYSSGLGRSRYKAKLIDGGVRISTGMIGKKNPENFEVGTPNATIGVRGTILEARMVDGTLYAGSSSGNLQVKNRGGKIDLGTEKFASVSSIETAPEALARRPGALGLGIFALPAGGIPFGTSGTPSTGAASLAGSGAPADSFGWAPALGGIVGIGAVVGVVVGAATGSQPTFSH